MDFKESVAIVTDRTRDANSVAGELVDAWGYDLSKRRPGIAYTNENGEQVTNLDMACLMSELVRWGSIINIPEYERSGPATRVEGQVVVSNENRHGKLVGLTSKEDVFNFGARIVDMNVMDSHNVGAYRTFLIMRNGVWWEGLRTIQFKPTPQEQERLAAIASDNKIVFDYFIHPLRWTSMYGVPYLLAKVVIERLSDEIKFLKNQVNDIYKVLKLEAIEHPHTETVEEEKKEETFWVFTAEVIGSNLDLKNEYAAVGKPTKDLLDTLSSRKSRLSQLRDHLKFQTRATEFAFFNQLKTRIPEDKLLLFMNGDAHDPTWTLPLAGWVKDKKWEHVIDKRTPWFIMNNIKKETALRFRIREKRTNVKK